MPTPIPKSLQGILWSADVNVKNYLLNLQNIFMEPKRYVKNIPRDIQLKPNHFLNRKSETI